MTAQEIRPRETVLLAEDYDAMVDWYRNTLGFRVTDRHTGDYRYTQLVNRAGIRVGIAVAKEMGTEVRDRKHNTVLMQFEVDDVRKFLEHVTANGGSVPFGPSFSEVDGFWYGGFADPEGNPYWVVDANCP